MLPPITYNDNGASKAVAVDIAKAIGEKIGYDIKVLGVNWESAQQKARIYASQVAKYEELIEKEIVLST